MRVMAGLAALMLLLAGCENAGGASATADKADSLEGARDAEAFASTGSGFDYRYAFRLPGDRLKGVLQSNADGCDKLGPARCRILAMRYQVDSANQIRAVLTINIDPGIARAYGEAVTKAVSGSGGVLTDTEISGADATAAARSAALVDRLRSQLRGAEAQVQSGTGDVAAARTRVERLQGALDTIAEVEAGQGQTLATAPVLITYESSSPVAGVAADANFRNAGQTFENTLAQLVTVLASVGPWLLLMIVVVLLLRWLVHGRAVPEGEGAPNAVPVAPEEDGHDNRNLIQRWFARDDGNDDEQR